MFLTAYYQSNLPYYFQQSNSLGSVGLGKSSPVPATSSRGVVIENGGAGIYYSLGSITVDGNPIGFVQIKNDRCQANPDSISRTTTDSLNIDGVNGVLLSDPFEIKSSSKILFSDYFVNGDSTVVTNLLGIHGCVLYKVDLVDAVNGNAIGTIKNTVVRVGELPENKVTTYSIKTTGIKDGKVKIRITFATNIDNPELRLVNDFSGADENGLIGTGAQDLTLQEIEVISDYALGQNYPNPFNPATTISYAIPEDGMVALKVFDVLGRDVKTLVNEMQKVGRYEVTFYGSQLASGVYFYRLVSGNHVITKKMLLVK